MKTQFTTLRALFTAALSLIAASSFAADITIYSGNDFAGRAAQLKRSEGSLQLGAARSVRVSTGIWEACTGANFTGTCVRLTPGDYREIGGQWGVGYASFREVSAGYGPQVAGGTLQLFTRNNYRGATLSVDQEISDLNADQYVVVVGSARVAGGASWELCTEPYFRGRCQIMTPGDHTDFARTLRERVASVRPVYQRAAAPVQESVPRGAYGAPRIELYTGQRYSGTTRAYTGEAANLNSTDQIFNDSVTSVRVTAGEWELCQHPNYTGACLVFGVGEYQYLPPQLQRQITSIRPIARSSQNLSSADFIEQLFGGVRFGGQLEAQVFAANAQSTRHPIWIFEGREFTGRSLRTRNDIADLRQFSFNDVAGSVFVTHGTWELCADLNFTGRCYTAEPGQHFELPFGRNGVTSMRRIR